MSWIGQAAQRFRRAIRRGRAPGPARPVPSPSRPAAPAAAEPGPVSGPAKRRRGYADKMLRAGTDYPDKAQWHRGY